MRPSAYRHHYTRAFLDRPPDPSFASLARYRLGSPTCVGTSGRASRPDSDAARTTSSSCIRAGMELKGAYADGVLRSISSASVRVASQC
jgi:hypothetical protein